MIVFRSNAPGLASARHACCGMLIDPPTRRLRACGHPAASEPLITPHLPPCMSSLYRSVPPDAGGGCVKGAGGAIEQRSGRWRPDLGR
eukprot:5672944-Prymnesium_polylepis.1